MMLAKIMTVLVYHLIGGQGIIGKTA